MTSVGPAFRPSLGLFSASDNGVIAYQRQTSRSSQLVWFDREGKRLGAAAPAADYNSVCLSGDERRIVYDLADPVSGSIDLWALDVGGDRPSRLTFNAAVDFYPVCSPSGQDVVFASLRDGPPNLYRLLTTAPGTEKALLNSPVPKIPTDWSRDGRLLVFMALNQKTSADIEVVPLASGPPQTVMATAANEHDGRLSPDGSELFYIGPDRKLIGVSVKSGSDFSVGEARSLVETRISSRERLGGQYAVTADGQRFLVNTASDTTLPVTLILNWTAALRKGAD